MDTFPSFNTGNRKKFLDQAKKKKQQKVSQTQVSPNDRLAIMIQKNIRRFLSMKNQKSPLFDIQKQIINSDSQEICNQLENLSNKGNYLFNMVHREGILRLKQENKKETERFRIICKVVGKNAHRISAIFNRLLKQQKKLWITQVLKNSDNFTFVYLTNQQVEFICKIFAENPDVLIKTLAYISNINLKQQLIRLLFSHSFKSSTLRQPHKNLSSLPLSQAYQTIISTIQGKKITELGQHPYFFLQFLNMIVNYLYDECQMQVMKKYKLNPILLQVEGDFLEEIINEKQQWVCFLDFLFASNQFNVSVVQWFVELMGLEQSKRACGYVTTVLRLIPLEYPLEISAQHLIICFRKISDWIKTHQIAESEEQQILFLPLLHIINRKFFEFSDKEFVIFAKKEGDIFQKILRDKFLKIIYKLILNNKTSKIAEEITKICVDLLEEIYNKIFRTKILSTQIFVNEVMSRKLTAYTVSKSDNEVSEFVKKFPFIFSLKDRARKFAQMLDLSRYHDIQEDFEQHYYHGVVKIRRGMEFEDAFSYLSNKNIKRGFKIVFINQFGQQQRGVDAGGLTKQFINRVLKAVFRPQFGMFIQNSDKQLIAHPQKAQVESGLIAEYYEFIGKIIGKALYQGITIGPKFSGPFLNSIIGKKNNFDDLSKIDKHLYNSLTYIKTMKQDASELYLTFQYKDQLLNKTISLKKQGNKIKVTKQLVILYHSENKNEYINLLANYKVNKLLEYQSRFIRKGLKKVINSEWLFMFNYQELNYLISGAGEIVVRELKMYTRYIGYKEGDATVRAFWEVVGEFDDATKSDLLMFVTSCPRPSFLGFQALNPPFTIMKKQDLTFLPVSHTCSNILQLPDYKDKEILAAKLKMAIRSGSGFDIA